MRQNFTRSLLHRCFATGSLLLAAALLMNGLTADEKPVPGPPDDKPAPPVAAPSPAAEHPANRLARESSPYLLMHAHNPIQWYPWGPEAFETAREQNKPVFLSIGYSSCYWCHVMEREVFSSKKIADYMNEHYICIKVDREERPDVDEIYMTSLIVYQQAAGIGGGGGWPLSMFLDAAGNPVAGATYLPPEDTPEGRVGFLTAAQRIHDLWTNNREAFDRTSSMLAREVRRLSGISMLAEPRELNEELLKTVADGIRSQYDPVWGGVDFNPRRPEGSRFPNVPRLAFLLEYASRRNDAELLAIVRHSLDSLARGGIRDHLGGGYHRYSTERTWTVPHFEKMLYDQAQLLEIHSRAVLVQPNPLDLQVIDELVQFLRRELLLSDGAFCSALDAETNAIEGEFYVWKEEEIRELLPDDAEELFLTAYGFGEPQDFEHGRILYIPPQQPQPDAAATEKLAACRKLLLEARSKRPRPFLDDKVLTEWNALMVQALAVSGRLPGRGDDLKLAENAARFLLKNLRDDSGLLLRSWRNGKPGPRAVLDDYACLVSALLELHASTSEDEWLSAAKTLMTEQIRLFHDAEQKTFFFTAHDHEKLIARTCSPYDSVSPSGNSLTVRNLIRLSHEHPEYIVIAKDLLTRFSGTVADSPASCAGLALGIQDLLTAAPKNNAALPQMGVFLARDAGARGFSTQRTQRTQRPRFGSDAGPWDSVRGPSGDSNGRILLTTLLLPPRQEPATPATQSPAATPAKDELKPASTQTPPEDLQNLDGADKPVRAVLYPLFDKLPRGGKCPVAIQLNIANNWHINANPASPENLIPTEIKLTSPHKVRMTRVKYPEHHEFRQSGTDDVLHVYDGKVTIFVLLEIEPDETSPEAELNFELRYQACSGETCLPPDKLRLSTRFKTASPDSEIRRINQSLFPAPVKQQPTTPGQPR
jgi:uncharacterized protein YyaL (SSP411 family)